MKRYEYLCENIAGELKDLFKLDKHELAKREKERLDELGREGWELAAVEGPWFYLKREIE